jgi:hypothetical protein
MSDPRRTAQLQCVHNRSARRASLVASIGAVRQDTERCTCRIDLWPPDNTDSATLTRRALDYCYPEGRLDVELGHRVKTAPGDENGDGFDEQLGCYVLAPDGTHLRFRIDGRRRPLFYPAFAVQQSAGKDAWVYVDFTVLETTGRNADGDLLFQIPSVVDDVVIVEVYLRDPSLDSPAD